VTEAREGLAGCKNCRPAIYFAITRPEPRKTTILPVILIAHPSYLCEPCACATHFSTHLPKLFFKVSFPGNENPKN